jgi:hypothetical protein
MTPHERELTVDRGYQNLAAGFAVLLFAACVVYAVVSQ